MIPNLEQHIAQLKQLYRAKTGAELELWHEHLPSPHRQPSLKNGWCAVYVFSLPAGENLERIILKVGKAGTKTKARFNSQHYNPQSSKSNLALKIIQQDWTWGRIGFSQENTPKIREWLLEKCERDHFYIKESDSSFLALMEGYFLFWLDPLYEGRATGEKS